MAIGLLAVSALPTSSEIKEFNEIREFSEVSDFAIFPNLLKFFICRSLLLLGNEEQVKALFCICNDAVVRHCD